MTYHYLIAFADLHRDEVGRIEVTRDQPISDLDDVNQIEADLRVHMGSSTVQVTGFSAFGGN
jgi:hypothetical protein